MDARHGGWRTFVAVPGWIVAGAVLLVGVAAALVVWTEPGSRAALRVALRFAPGDVTVGRLHGTLASAVQLHDVRVSGVQQMPPGSVLSVQRADVSLKPLPYVYLFNGKLEWPASSPVAFSGTYDAGVVDLQLGTSVIDLRDAMTLLLGKGKNQGLTGQVRDLTLQVAGRPAKPAIRGTFTLASLHREAVHLRECPGEMDLTVRTRPTELVGFVRCEAGLLAINRTSLKLDPSTIRFTGSPNAPAFDIEAHGRIEGLTLRMELAGTAQDPKLSLRSSPPLPPEHLVAVLLTGQRWESVEATMAGDAVPPELAKDVLDYALFGGVGSQLRAQLGLDVDLNYTGKEAGIDVTKQVGERLSIGAGFKQMVDDDSGSSLSERIRSEVELSEDTALELEAQRAENAQSAASAEPSMGGTVAEHSLTVKVKKTF